MVDAFGDERDESSGATCVDCGARPPPTETNYTLISSRYGWRLTRAIDSDGNRMMEWRCPRCWLRHRGRSATVPKTRP